MRDLSLPTGVAGTGHVFHDPALAECAAIARKYNMQMLNLLGTKAPATSAGASQAANQQQSGQITPGSMYGAPGYTNPVEQLDTTQGLVTAGAGGQQNTINGITPLAQTDVVLGWDLFVTYSFATAPVGGTGQTLSVSPYAPYNMLGPVTLSLQNQYKPIDVLSGRDLGIFQSYRGRYLRSDRRNANLASPVLGAAYSSGVWCEAALLEAANVWSTTYTTTGKTFVVHLPASIEFDLYYPLDISGNLVGTPGRAIVSPQYMGGTTRIVSPKIALAQGLGTVDTSPFGTTTSGSTASTFTAGCTRGSTAVAPRPKSRSQFPTTSARSSRSGSCSSTPPPRTVPVLRWPCRASNTVSSSTAPGSSASTTPRRACRRAGSNSTTRCPPPASSAGTSPISPTVVSPTRVACSTRSPRTPSRWCSPSVRRCRALATWSSPLKLSST